MTEPPCWCPPASAEHKTAAVSCGQLRSAPLPRLLTMYSSSMPICAVTRSVVVSCGQLRSVAVSCGQLWSVMVSVSCGQLRSVPPPRPLTMYSSSMPVCAVTGSVAVSCGQLRSVPPPCPPALTMYSSSMPVCAVTGSVVVSIWMWT